MPTPTPTKPFPRFGVWALVHGSRAALQDPNEPYDASWARNKALVLEAEQLGYDSVLVAQHTINPQDASLDQLEAWTTSAALAALTSRIEIIAAIKPYLYHPVVLAKMAQQIEHISGGRFAINLVNAWNRPELERAGIGFPEHDARYAYGREWIEVVDALLRGETLNHHGDNFRIDEYQLRPADPFRARPRIYVGGESEPARELVAAHGDVWFINGQPHDDVARLIADVSSRERRAGHAPLRFGLSAFVIARQTQAEADAHLGHLFALAELDKPLRERQKANIDPNVVMIQTFAQSPRVGSNGGTAAGLVGDYDTVAKRIAEFHRAGIELFMLQFQPFEADMRSFAEEVAPRVRRLLSA
ncbi:Flavin-dependent oxidoreductase, luciferase family (includes alkanesulfonate monooxygenase SsuD and methylene tetrahydromethanopterin reductase) [Burkholderia sp. YR290]|jgi:alkanesulfonate monooxygenase|uniref:LLM class flavin-dependent oxidoreductase n=1 Tax=Paraburkholderia hospita TaxID=169430 RepID=UPI0009A86437|nr:LLM class flavin-dependent oxidoreductase [Paraburkholderia hospita]SKD01977.1 Flavin-dependent oxidoreductase, luciferase family (includes alkanesulfonate monooxygenase SsuD and methylene tetrahydromethanopterin reductase) [Paraburkholderia hospita]SOE83787.1 Flavin-dependent oxidoreductase, luciferase family (includes alkanesulfonate monooxygenase SsuD and methylene tetrahydromethanopterin reductase) [Burkholderia sp. YR290]